MLSFFFVPSEYGNCSNSRLLLGECPAEHASIVQLLANKKIHNQILRIKHKIDNIHYNDIEMAFVTSSGIKLIETSINLSMLKEKYKLTITMYLV